MSLKNELSLIKDVSGLEIPLGSPIKLKKGTKFRITQNLGGAFTIFTKTGHLVRVEGEFAPALGQKKIKTAAGKNTRTKLPPSALRRRVLAQLKTCFDPEIPVNIYDLGLIYSYKLDSLEPKTGLKAGESAKKKTHQKKDKKKARSQKQVQAGSTYQAVIKMTLTMPGCGMGDVLAAEVKQKVLTIAGINQVKIDLVMDPPWDQSRLSKEARLQLGL